MRKPYRCCLLLFVFSFPPNTVSLSIYLLVGRDDTRESPAFRFRVLRRLGASGSFSVDDDAVAVPDDAEAPVVVFVVNVAVSSVAGSCDFDFVSVPFSGASPDFLESASLPFVDLVVSLAALLSVVVGV